MKETQWMTGPVVAALAVPAFTQDVSALTVNPQDGVLPPIPTFTSDTVQLDTREAEGMRLANRQKTHPDRPRRGDDDGMEYLSGATQPALVCAPLNICNIILQGGEIANGTHVGDKPRWKITSGTMSAGEDAATVLVVKSADVGLTITLTVTTDRCLYSIKLVSRVKGSMPDVSFDYLDDMDRAQAAYREQRAKQTCSNTMSGVGGQGLVSLGLGSRLGGDSPSWKPVRVYTNGAKTYTQFPTSSFDGKAPALVAKGNGGWFSRAPEKLISYHPVGNRYVIDCVIGRVSLVVGADDDQTEVTITRAGGKQMARFQLMASLTIALLLSAYATSRSAVSYVEPPVTATDSITLSREVVVYLADALPLARTMLVLDPPAAKDQDHLTATPLPTLRARDYGVTLTDLRTDRPAGQGVALCYLASPPDGGVLVHLQHQGAGASRYYSCGTSDLLLPGTPFTIRGGYQ